MEDKIITVFGSSIPLPGEEEYENAYKLGKLLAENGFSVCTGGCQGIMDAVSKGATEKGKSALGVTVEIFNSVSSKFLTTEIKCDTLFKRIDNLISYGNGYIILPGGTGTLLELAAIWELINKNVIEKKPIVCIGSLWKTVVEAVDNRLVLEKRETGLVKYRENAEEAVEYLKCILK